MFCKKYNFFKENISRFDRTDLPGSGDIAKHLCIIISAVMIYCIFYYLTCNVFHCQKLNEFLVKMIKEWFAPIWFNIVGSCGSILFGAWIIFPKKSIADASVLFLGKANRSGVILLCVIVGDFICNFTRFNASTLMEQWGLCGLFGFYVMSLICILAGFWVLSYWVKQETIQKKINQIYWFIRCPISCVFIGAPLLWVWHDLMS